MALQNALDKVIEVHSEKISKHTNCYICNYIENVFKKEELIELLLGVPRNIKTAHFEGEKFGLTTDEITFYDAFTKHESVKDFYSNDGLICITKILRKNNTTDWQKKEIARAGMRRIVEHILKSHCCPPEKIEYAIGAVIGKYEMMMDQG